jgi:hypothetical protein
VIVISRRPMREVLLPGMLDRLMEVIERRPLELACTRVVPLRVAMRFAMRRVVQHVLIEPAVVVGLLARMPVVPLVSAEVPMIDLIFVAQVQLALVLVVRSANAG